MNPRSKSKRSSSGPKETKFVSLGNTFVFLPKNRIDTTLTAGQKILVELTLGKRVPGNDQGH
jgi:hypothetical protein